MTTTPDPKTAREIAREHLADFLRRWPMVDPFFVGSRVLGALDDPELWRTDPAAYNAWCEATVAEIRTAVPSWPGEQPQDDGDVRAVARTVWMYGTAEHSSEYAYATIEAAQTEAIWEYDPTLAEYPEYWSWEPCPPQNGRLAMLCGDDRTGYTVFPVTVVEQRPVALEARDAKAPAKRTPEQWCKQYSVDIADPDGWRHTDAPAWNEPITLADFYERARKSTVRLVGSVDWKHIARDAKPERNAADGGAAPTCGTQISASTAQNIKADPLTLCARTPNHVEPVHADAAFNVLWADPKSEAENG
jgi:hypothetical protein